jgi:hypothetical protein
MYYWEGRKSAEVPLRDLFGFYVGDMVINVKNGHLCELVTDYGNRFDCFDLITETYYMLDVDSFNLAKAREIARLCLD